VVVFERFPDSVVSYSNLCVKGPCCLALILALLTLFAAAGCKKSPPAGLTPSKIHAITKELASAARAAAPKGASIHAELHAAEGSPQAADTLDITLASPAEGISTRNDAAKIQQALASVATRHSLTEKPSQSQEGILFFYLKAGVTTHEVHIHFSSKSSAADRNPAVTSHGPELAIILDDLGSDRAAAEAIFAFPYPLTISVLPNHEHSTDIAQEAERRGFQVMLHLPMQAVANERPEARELRPGMPAAEISSTVEQFLQTVPGAIGVNNHQGSQATSDQQLMSELMPVLSADHLFYVDSRTTGATVAYDTAQSLGVPSAYRNVPFLDDVNEVAAVRKQLGLALRGAREKGEALAIGHPHPATLEALREVLPQAPARGVRLVFASELVH